MLLTRYNTVYDPPFSPGRLQGLRLWLDAAQSPITLTAGMAAQFALATSEYLSQAGTAALLGGTTWWRSIWFYLDTTTTAQTLFATRNTNDGMSLVTGAAGTDVSLVVGNGTGVATATFTISLSTATWYHAYVEFDGTNIGISIDNGTIVQQALGGAFSAGAGGLNVGANLTPLLFVDGRLQCFFGANGVLTTAQRTTNYNAGVPLSYAQSLTSGITPLFAYELDEPSGTRVDLVSAANLTDNNTVTTSAGTCLNAVSQWNDLSGMGNHATQATQANKPRYRVSILNGLPVLRLDATDDRLDTSLASQAQPFYALAVVKQTNKTATSTILDSTGGGATRANLVLNTSGRVSMFAGSAITEAANDHSGAFRIIDAMFNTTGSEAFVDGTSVVTGNVGTNSWANLRVGASSAAASVLDGDIHAVVLLNRLPSSSERQKLRNYYSRRTGIAVA